MQRFLSVVALGTVALGAGVAHADPTVEVGGTAGIHIFATDDALGVPPVKDADSQRNSALFGLRFGLFFNKMIGVEIEGGVIPSEGRNQVYDVWDAVYRGHLVLQYAKTGYEKILPFLVVGGGGISVVSTDGQGDQTKIQKDTNGQLYAGLGVKYRVDNGFGLRADARIYFEPSSQNKSFTEDAEFLLSIYREWGRPKKPVPIAKAKDTDGDGIPDEKDKCPNEPEDKDGFQDDDGCPDPDNDGDGIPDAVDKCPVDAEDFDGFQDADGCPDLDNDGDGIPDAQDKCPNDPEDKDGFQDADGCPDPDNDGDGIPDIKDRCPDQPETKNGYQDEDGCPDEVPQKLKKFSGTIQGINFKVGSDEILASSNTLLDEAVKVLTEYKDINLEISGHTDDQDFKAPAAAKIHNNMELSQARADSVKAYMVKKGIDPSRLNAKGMGDSLPIIDPKGLTGAKLQEARTKNRRVEFKLISTNPGGAPPAAPGAAKPATPPPAKPAGTATPAKPAGTATPANGSATPPATPSKP
jgi:OOP family OmpA-OmpF porin